MPTIQLFHAKANKGIWDDIHSFDKNSLNASSEWSWRSGAGARGGPGPLSALREPAVQLKRLKGTVTRDERNAKVGPEVWKGQGGRQGSRNAVFGHRLWKVHPQFTLQRESGRARGHSRASHGVQWAPSSELTLSTLTILHGVTHLTLATTLWFHEGHVTCSRSGVWKWKILVQGNC